jgi:surface protein
MFAGCTSLKSISIAKWNTSEVVVMEGAFQDCSALTSLDISGWSTPETLSMGYLFDGCSALKTINMGKFDTSSVTNATVGSNYVYGSDYMFNGCVSLSRWTVGSKYEIKTNAMVPEATAENGKWWSKANSAWYTKEAIVKQRSGLAGTYTSSTTA